MTVVPGIANDRQATAVSSAIWSPQAGMENEKPNANLEI